MKRRLLFLIISAIIAIFISACSDVNSPTNGNNNGVGGNNSSQNDYIDDDIEMNEDM